MKKQRSLFWQLFPSYIFITLISIMIVTWYACVTLEAFYLKQITKDLNEGLAFLKEYIHLYLNPINEKEIDALCKKTGSFSHTRFTVILPSGKVIGDSIASPDKMDNHSDRPEIIQAIKYGTGRSMRFSYTLHRKMIYLATSLKHGSRTTVILRAAFPFSYINAQLLMVRRKILIASLFVALCTVLICIYMSRRISRPIENIREGAQHFSAGDFDYRLSSEGVQEIRELSLSMNHMAAELKKRFDIINRQRSELETILFSMAEGVLTFDNNEHLVSINESAVKMLGIDPVWARGKTLEEIIRNPSIARLTSQTLKRSQDIREDIVVYTHDEIQKDRVVSVHTTPWKGPRGDMLGVLLVLNDVTHLRRLEDMRRDFVSNASHEMRTPVTAIKAAVETLADETATKDEVKRFLKIIERQVIRLELIIKDLLDLSMIEQKTEKGDIELSEQRLIHILESAVNTLALKANEKNIRIDLICPDLLQVKANPSLLEHGVINLLDNAINYSEQDSSVVIRAEKTENEIVISVIDEGIGIKTEFLSRIFERFYRVDKGRSRNAGGTGLGLAIVKHVASAHGGTTHVKSTFGAGSCFEIHLPIS